MTTAPCSAATRRSRLSSRRRRRAPPMDAEEAAQKLRQVVGALTAGNAAALASPDARDRLAARVAAASAPANRLLAAALVALGDPRALDTACLDADVGTAADDLVIALSCS